MKKEARGNRVQTTTGGKEDNLQLKDEGEGGNECLKIAGYRAASAKNLRAEVVRKQNCK